METCDIILFSDPHFLPSRIIEFSSQSIYSHVGIIVKDCLGLTGTYILESTGFSDIPDATDNKIKWGVQIRPFDKVKEEYDGSVFHRRVTCIRDEEFYKNLESAYAIVRDASYNTSPLEWFSLLIGKDVDREYVVHNSFVCSTLVAFIFEKLNLISRDEDFSLVRPKDLGTELRRDVDANASTSRVKFINCTVEYEIKIK